MAMRLFRTGLGRKTVFGYACARCLTCCRFKTIQLNPYEVARMARNLEISTTDFISRFTEKGGTVLRSNADGTCVFLDADGCSVHADRPLVCRLYPLGRHVGFDGEEEFSRISPEDGCRGRYHETGTVETYLDEQGAFPFMHAADRYLDLLRRLIDHVAAGELDSAGQKAVIDTVNAASAPNDGAGGAAWNDMDRVLADHGDRTGANITIHETIEDRMTRHIEAVLSWATSR
ncbi:hypothetical protein JCM14469_15100 [Desulfatiferula olefinivorans]